MRQYHLYVRNRSQFEIVPDGVAWGALLLGPLWAAAYGLFFLYVGLLSIALVPVLISLLINGAVGDTTGLFVLIIANGAHIYFCLKAFEWRSRSLCSQGYSKWASIPASSAKDALESWSRSDEAKKFMEGAA